MTLCHALDKLSSASRIQARILAYIAQKSCPIVHTTVTRTVVTHVLRCPVGECTCSFATENSTLFLSPKLVTCLAAKRCSRVPVQ